MKFIILAIAIIAFVSVAQFAFRSGIDESAKADCYKWQEWAAEYPDFWITQDQKTQCDYYHLTVAAPVR